MGRVHYMYRVWHYPVGICKRRVDRWFILDKTREKRWRIPSSPTSRSIKRRFWIASCSDGSITRSSVCCCSSAFSSACTLASSASKTAQQSISWAVSEWDAFPSQWASSLGQWGPRSFLINEQIERVRRTELFSGWDHSKSIAWPTPLSFFF